MEAVRRGLEFPGPEQPSSDLQALASIPDERDRLQRTGERLREVDGLRQHVAEPIRICVLEAKGEESATTDSWQGPVGQETACTEEQAAVKRRLLASRSGADPGHISTDFLAESPVADATAGESHASTGRQGSDQQQIQLDHVRTAGDVGIQVRDRGETAVPACPSWQSEVEKNGEPGCQHE